MKPDTYVNGGPWAIRKRTFLGSWEAVEANSASDPTAWKLKPNFAEIFVEKALTRAGVTHRVPVVDLAAWLFREREFAAKVTARDLEKNFRGEFPFEDADYNRIFEFNEEQPAALFTPDKPAPSAIRDAVQKVLIDEKAPPPDPPPLVTPQHTSLLKVDDSVYTQVMQLLELGTSGIIFRGCPGTSKTWYAKQIAYKLVADTKAHIFQCQFHPSYGYEDFVEGYRPDQEAKSGFKIIDKVFLQACAVARDPATKGGYVVFIIDEINRGDPARVFGELLTYIEHGYRGDEFSKAYTGEKVSVPKNLVVLGTMNQFDRSISQLDIALTRRFDHIDLHPDNEIVEEFLEKDGNFKPEQIQRVSKWFTDMQELLKPWGIGHTFFKDVSRPDQLRLVWQYRMLPYCESILELEPGRMTNVRGSFEGMFKAITGQGES